MNAPAVSVILPAFNCEKYIGKAIQSLLSQSFQDFELIVINDGSTDNTESVILEFTDPRIIYQKNLTNQGLIFTLNKAIDLARGKFIARMDADDICIPQRLEKQFLFLEEHNHIALVGCTVILIDEKDDNIGLWHLDQQTVNSKKIKYRMPFENCIAHPSIMIRSSILMKIKYDPAQKNIEDYNLWLKLLNRGFVIDKIKEPLLLYRIHENSVTGLHLKKRNVFFKHAKMKIRCLWKEFISGHISFYMITIKIGLLTDLVRGMAKSIKSLFIRHV